MLFVFQLNQKHEEKKKPELKLFGMITVGLNLGTRKQNKILAYASIRHCQVKQRRK